jgi:GDP/UDP-N,N'-diacetylbacillosamine 2-epimerase (hydrolysing)
MKRKIAIVTGTRAEYGLLKNLISLVNEDKSVELQLLVTGAHLMSEYGNTYKSIEEDGIPICKKIDISLSVTSEVSVAKSLGIATSAFAEVFDELKPDLLILLGDRYEILAAAQAAMILKIPIGHIHGGETTEGAIDEAIRHSVTKMSHLHFVSTALYKKRVIQLGENPERVYNLGAPGLDNIKNIQFLTTDELEKELQIQFSKQIFVVTYHPVTLENQSPQVHLNQLFMALDEFSNTSIVITLPNADPHSNIIIDSIEKFAKDRKHIKVCASLGIKKYLSLVKIANVVIGNSSSGLIEAPALKVPTVNIGNRQKGRISGPSVIHCADQSHEISQSIKKALSTEFRELTQSTESLYGDGNTSPKIFDIIKNIELEGLIFKSFYDL